MRQSNPEGCERFVRCRGADRFRGQGQRQFDDAVGYILCAGGVQASYLTTGLAATAFGCTATVHKLLHKPDAVTASLWKYFV